MFTFINSTVAFNSVVAGNAGSGGTGGTATTGTAGTAGTVGTSGPAIGGGVSTSGAGAILNLTNDTVAYNSAVQNRVGRSVNGTGGGVSIGVNAAGSTANFANTLVARNTATTGPDVVGTVAKSQSNLIGNADGSTGFGMASGDNTGTTARPVDPGLAGALGNNGGPTQTLALLSGSPALGAGNEFAPSSPSPFDQRGPGFPRLAGASIDIGAVAGAPAAFVLLTNGTIDTFTEHGGAQPLTSAPTFGPACRLRKRTGSFR